MTTSQWPAVMLMASKYLNHSPGTRLTVKRSTRPLQQLTMCMILSTFQLVMRLGTRLSLQLILGTRLSPLLIPGTNEAITRMWITMLAPFFYTKSRSYILSTHYSNWSSNWNNSLAAVGVCGSVMHACLKVYGCILPKYGLEYINVLVACIRIFIHSLGISTKFLWSMNNNNNYIHSLHPCLVNACTCVLGGAQFISSYLQCWCFPPPEDGRDYSLLACAPCCCTATGSRSSVSE